ncbi:MAG TPA: LpqB family beta-propeller domain-containing protein [bacterium]|nr:LpqB family beta-propeller domain-containing protein [bacterium]HOL48683.1 LpqB family beta-propeller domain-containing protein [bacterium]HPQ20048.1 LpqB family beta-propeller domain-containing protein [bacterium]
MNLSIHNYAGDKKFGGIIYRNFENYYKNVREVVSGKKTTYFYEDPSGIILSERANTKLQSLQKVNTELQTGQSMIQLADYALSECESILIDMRNYALQASNGSLSAEDKETLQNRISEKINSLNDMVLNTKFNDKWLLTTLEKLGNMWTTIDTNNSNITDISVPGTSRFQPVEAGLNITVSVSGGYYENYRAFAPIYNSSTGKYYISAELSGTGQWNYWEVNPDGSNFSKVNTYTGTMYGDVSPNGNYFVYVKGADRMVYYSTIGGAETLVGAGYVTPNTRTTNATIAPNNNTIAFVKSSDNQVYRVNLDGSGEQQLTSGINATNLSWSPDGNILYITDNLQNIYYINNPLTINAPVSPTDTNLDGRWVEVSPDNSKIAYISGGNIYYADTSTFTASLIPDTNDVYSAGRIDWIDNNTIIYSKSGVFDIYKISLDGSNKTLIQFDLPYQASFNGGPATAIKKDAYTQLEDSQGREINVKWSSSTIQSGTDTITINGEGPIYHDENSFDLNVVSEIGQLIKNIDSYLPIDMDSVFDSLEDISITTFSGAQSAVANIDNVLAIIREKRANLGASNVKIEEVLDFNEQYAINTTEFLDSKDSVNYVSKLFEFTRNQLLSVLSMDLLNISNLKNKNIVTILGIDNEKYKEQYKEEFAI